MRERKSKVVAHTKKRKEAPSSDSEYDVEQKVQDITPLKKDVGKKVTANVPEVPIYNISFHSVENVEKWKFVYQKRLALERYLGKDALECKEVVSLIENAGLMKSVDGFNKCYEMLVKEFIVNIPTDCDNKKSKEYKKVYVRGVEFSPEVIYRFKGRCEDEQAEVEVTDNTIYKEIIVKHVSQWSRKGKLSDSKLSVKYTVKMPIVFPSLICGKILSQHPGILISSDATSKRESLISLNYRLFAGTHVPHIVMPSGKETVAQPQRMRMLMQMLLLKHFPVLTFDMV
ncbi:uncharacterized protein LOC127103034 [Lathyrus oleraceus]|uniref:uncharacterized protein LOC127103034 n=1 Tax=Pisum sativum TaxID=3888 RepID=UPI0021D3D9BD|nr:uncharacterized protein LOC127103034 [Pisum sativum]